MAVALKAGDRYTENDGYDRRIRTVGAYHPAVLRELHEVVGLECDKRGLSRG